MKYTTIEEINDLENRFPVLHFKGVIKSAFAPRTGESEFGEWKVQSAVIEDDTGEITVSFMDSKNDNKEFSFQDLRNYIGSEVKADCSKSDKHGFVGITTNDYTNKKSGKVSRQLKITDNAQVYLDENISTPAENSDDTVVSETKTTHKVDYNQQAKETKESYEKQAALRAAVEFVGNNDGGTIDDVVKAALAFYGFFTND